MRSFEISGQTVNLVGQIHGIYQHQCAVHHRFWKLRPKDLLAALVQQIAMGAAHPDVSSLLIAPAKSAPLVVQAFASGSSVEDLQALLELYLWGQTSAHAHAAKAQLFPLESQNQPCCRPKIQHATFDPSIENDEYLNTCFTPAMLFEQREELQTKYQSINALLIDMFDRWFEESELDMIQLDLFHPPKERTLMIEASAGTGKTYSISKLVIHEIMAGRKLSEILVVTFTVAATQELRERIREDLMELKSALGKRFTTPAELNDEEQALADVRSDQSSEEAMATMRTALMEFDQASCVHHSMPLCQRWVQENAFETGAAFDVDLITDMREIQDVIVKDFIRQRYYFGQENPILGDLFPKRAALLEAVVQQVPHVP